MEGFVESDRNGLTWGLDRTSSSWMVALIVAAAVAWFGVAMSRSVRLVNLRVTQGGFPQSYLMLSKTEEGRGYLVRRRASTIRRSRKKQAGRQWDVERFGGVSEPGMPDHWLLRSEASGTVFFVPVHAVDNKDYPFVYDFVRTESKEQDLPVVTWTQLYVNRVYRGLYLRMDLPFDPRKKDGGSGIRRELLTVRDNEMSVVDTRFVADTRLFAGGIAQGRFPTLSPPSDALAWLTARQPHEEMAFLLNSAEPFDVSLLPLPLSLNALFEKLHGRKPLTTAYDRYLRWTAGDWCQTVSAVPPFDDAQRQRFEILFTDYKERFRTAHRVHQSLNAAPKSDARVAGPLDRNTELVADD